MAGNILKKIMTPIRKFPLMKLYKNTTSFIKRRPLGSFFIALLLLFLVILLGHALNTPKQQAAQKPTPIAVSVYSIGQAPKVTFQAQIEKMSVIKIVAQTAGVVQGITVTEGSKVTQGEQLMTLDTNYQGDNAAGVQSQIAQAQYQNVQDSYSEQQDAIEKQKDIANITLNNYTDQQNIATQSANNTQSLINQNQSVLDSLNSQLTTDQNNNVPQSTIVPEETQINSLQSAQNQLNQSLSDLGEQTDSTKPPGQLAYTQRDLTLEQLDIQEKSLALNKEVTQLQAELAAVNVDTTLPASPVAGVVEKVYVRAGQNVTIGTELAAVTSSASDPQTIAVVEVPQQIAQNISRLETSDVYLNGFLYHIKPYYVSSEATDGLLYSVFYSIPTDEISLVTDGEYISVAIPVGSPSTSAAVPFVPIDAVYQTQDSNYLLVARNNKAVTRKVSLGNIYGNYIEITSGLQSGDLVILDRNVIAGDTISTK